MDETQRLQELRLEIVQMLLVNAPGWENDRLLIDAARSVEAYVMGHKPPEAQASQPIRVDDNGRVL